VSVRVAFTAQRVAVPVEVNTRPAVPEDPTPSTKAALRVVVLLAVKVPLAVVFAPTYKSAVRVVLPVTAKVPVTVALLATISSVVRLVVVLPSLCKPVFSTQAVPFQCKVELVAVPDMGAKLSIQLVLVPVELSTCPAVPTSPLASTKPPLRVVVALLVTWPLLVTELLVVNGPVMVVVARLLSPNAVRVVLTVRFSKLALVVSMPAPTNSKVLVPVWLKLRLPVAVSVNAFPSVMAKVVWVALALFP